MEWIEVENKPRPRYKGSVWVKCIAEIRDNSTGEIREYETHEILIKGDKYPSVFSWAENNNACDCNRLLYFKRAKNEETDADWNVECSDGKFSVNLKNKLDGKVYYREFTA